MNMHFKNFLSLLLILCCYTTHAEWLPAMINDTDGYTNIRKEAIKTSEIVATLSIGELFYCNYSPDTEWLEVRYKMIHKNNVKQIEGYIHKNRVLLLKDLEEYQQKGIIADIFNRQIQLAEALNKDSTPSQLALADYKLHSEILYLPILDLLPVYYCKTSDSEVLNLFFSVLWADRGSANEAPSWAFANCFVCFPKKVSNQIRKINDTKEKSVVIDQLEFGISNLGYIDKDNIINLEYSKLIEELAKK